VLLVRDPVLPSIQEIGAPEVARLLASGQLPGGKGKAYPFLNPHTTGPDSSRVEHAKEVLAAMLGGLRCVVLNAGVANPEGVARRLLELL